jgi:hypothetical protein
MRKLLKFGIWVSFAWVLCLLVLGFDTFFVSRPDVVFAEPEAIAYILRNYLIAIAIGLVSALTCWLIMLRKFPQ